MLGPRRRDASHLFVRLGVAERLSTLGLITRVPLVGVLRNDFTLSAPRIVAPGIDNASGFGIAADLACAWTPCTAIQEALNGLGGRGNVFVIRVRARITEVDQG